MVKWLEGKILAVDVDGCWLVRGLEWSIFLLVDEITLGFWKVRGKEDVVAEGQEDGVEIWRGRRTEDWDGS